MFHYLYTRLLRPIRKINFKMSNMLKELPYFKYFKLVAGTLQELEQVAQYCCSGINKNTNCPFNSKINSIKKFNY